MSSSSRSIDGIAVTFDEPTLVADAGLSMPATLMVRLAGAPREPDGAASWPRRRSSSRPQGADDRDGDPGRGIPHRPCRSTAGRCDRAGAALPWMAPSTLGTFLRSFTFGHVRQLDAVIAETIREGVVARSRSGESKPGTTSNLSGSGMMNVPCRVTGARSGAADRKRLGGTGDEPEAPGGIDAERPWA